MTVGSEPTPTVAEPATRVTGRRAVAHLVDGLLFAVVFAALMVLFALLPSGVVTRVLFVVAIVFMLTLGLVGFFALIHRRNGRSPGKRLMGLRVVDAQGQPPRFGALVKRSVPLILEALFIVPLGAMLSSPYRQRFGDRWAGTYVVKADAPLQRDDSS